MGYKILNLLAKIFPGLGKLGHEDWQPENEDEEDEEPEFIQMPFVVCSSVLEETPEALFRTDRLNNFNRGQYGDIELFPNYEELLIRRAFNERLERRIIGG